MKNIKVLGSGCPNCIKLENLCREVIDENGIDAQVEKVTDFAEIEKFGVMMTPALVVEGEVLLQGKIPAKNTLKHWLEDGK